MKLSFNWLKEYVDIKLSPEELADKLTLATAQVEEVKYLGAGLDKVVVGEILEISKHPNADRLRVTKVKTGQGEPLQIVCGAPNIEVGQKVPVALVGAVLPNGMEIKKSAIRGVESAGMLCAEDELGLGTGHAGILILNPETEVGKEFKEVFGLDDAVLEIENKSLTHRPDLFCHIGIAREITAITDSRLKIKDSRLKIKENKSNEILSVKVEDEELCPRYMACVMEGVEVKESPDWIKKRLQAVGIRPINNIVDITNYVLMEYGQPLHVFDFEKLHTNHTRINHKLVPESKHEYSSGDSRENSGEIREIFVRRAKDGEKILALDGKEYELDENNLVIADSQKPIAIAGVMGGEETGVTGGTKTIIIESANFHPTSIRKTSWGLGLRSDSSLRFEKGLPLILAEWGMLRAIELLEELAGGKPAGQIIDIKNSAAAEALKNSKIKLDTDKVRAVTGEEIGDKKIKSILERLGFEVGADFKVSVLLFRNDIKIEEDLIEEIARIYGYGQIKPASLRSELKPSKLPAWNLWQRRIKEILAGAGFDEIYNYSFYGENLLKKSGLKTGEHNFTLANPLNPDQKFLRISLLPQVCQAAEKNGANFEIVKIFEIGHIYPAEGEKPCLAGAIFRKDKERYAGAIERSEAKGAVELILSGLGIKNEDISYAASAQVPVLSDYHTKALDIFLKGAKVGVVDVLDYDNLDKKSPRAECFELDLEKIIDSRDEAKICRPIPAYPAVERDFAFVMNRSVKYGDIAGAVQAISSLVAEINYLNVFASEELGRDKKSLAFRVVFQSSEKTLTSEEADAAAKKITEELKNKFNAEIRR